MQVPNRPSLLLFLLLTTLGASSINLGFASASWAQVMDEPLSGELTIPTMTTDADVPAHIPGEPLISVNLSSGNTPVTLEGDRPTTDASSVAPHPAVQMAQTVEFPIVASPVSETWSTTAEDLQAVPPSPASLTVSQDSDRLFQAASPAQVAQRIDPAALLDAGNAFTFRVGGRVPVPTALQGATRPRTVLPGSNRTGGISGIVRLDQEIGDGELALEIEGGEHILAIDVGFTSDIIAPRQGFGFNFFNQRSFFPAFREGDRDVDLPNGDEPWLHRLGGGVEYYQPFGEATTGAVGVSYQRVSVRDDLFTSDVESIDEFGNSLTVDGDGIDDLLTLNLAINRDTRDDTLYPTTGSRIRFGADQGFTLGDEDIAFTRLAANYTQFLPFSLFGFEEGPRTLVFNLQGGVVLGDTPPYEGFNLGGVNSVRGYDKGAVGTGTSFVQATVEYRFPIFSLSVAERDIGVGGTLFVDYASDLDSGDEVIGEPAEVRDKPGDGLGFGVGLRIRSPIGPLRAEFGFNDDGDSVFYFTTSDRF